jgi:alpha-L-fucosidase
MAFAGNIDNCGLLGNNFLNVGPTAEGTIPQPCIDRLAEVGRWMDVNGGAIYGSMPWKVTEEKHAASGRVLHFTSKGDGVHVFCPVNGTAGDLAIQALGSGPLAGRKIASVTLLGSDAKVKWSQDTDKLTLSVPAEAPGGIMATYRVELRP